MNITTTTSKHCILDCSLKMLYLDGKKVEFVVRRFGGRLIRTFSYIFSWSRTTGKNYLNLLHASWRLRIIFPDDFANPKKDFDDQRLRFETPRFQFWHAQNLGNIKKIENSE